jgi:hypothetical protein
LRLSPDAGKIRPQPGKRLKSGQPISVSDENDVIDWFFDNRRARQSWPEGKSSGYLLSVLWF